MLYPSGMLLAQLCGQLSYMVYENWVELMPNILNDSFFGCCEVDIEVPEYLWNQFAEFPPLFINVNVDSSKCGEYINLLIQRLQATEANEIHKRYRHKIERKLISTFKAVKILLITPLLKWYLVHGLIVTRLYGIVRASRYEPFKGFVEWGANERRNGDV